MKQVAPNATKRQVGETRSVVESGSVAYSNITAEPHEYFYHKPPGTNIIYSSTSRVFVLSDLAVCGLVTSTQASIQELAPILTVKAERSLGDAAT
jgi:hypothetical protein